MLLWFVKIYERNLKKLQFTTQRFDTLVQCLHQGCSSRYSAKITQRHQTGVSKRWVVNFFKVTFIYFYKPEQHYIMSAYLMLTTYWLYLRLCCTFIIFYKPQEHIYYSTCTCINNNIWHLHSLSVDESQSYVQET